MLYTIVWKNMLSEKLAKPFYNFILKCFILINQMGVKT